MNNGLSIVFDNAPSSHKEGFIEEEAINNDIIIFHLPQINDKIHPSERYLKKKLFKSCRFKLNPGNNVKQIKKQISKVVKNKIDGKQYQSISIIYSFLDLKRLYYVRFLSKICKNYSSQVQLIPYFEPIRLNDILVLPRIIKVCSSLLIQKFCLKAKKLYLFSNLNRFFYEIFFDQIFLYPYKDSKLQNKVDNNEIINSFNSYDRCLNIIFIGQLIERKDPLILLKASIALKFKVKISYFGVGPLENKLKKFIKDQNNSNIEVKFYGFLENQKLIRIINEYDVIVLPSRFDGFGFVISEAIKYGTYAIVSDQVGSKDLLIDGSKGSVFRAGSKNQLINQLSIHYLRMKIRNLKL